MANCLQRDQDDKNARIIEVATGIVKYTITHDIGLIQWHFRQWRMACKGSSDGMYS